MKYSHEIICIIVALCLFLLASLPLSTLQNYLPFLTSNEYEIWYSKSGYNTISIEEIYIDGALIKNNQKFNIHKKINLKVKYRNNNGNSNEIKYKEISFDPYQYFKNKAELTNLDGFVSQNFYQVYINDLV